MDTCQILELYSMAQERVPGVFLHFAFFTEPLAQWIRQTDIINGILKHGEHHCMQIIFSYT
jgi:hypothetical protein